MRRGVRLLPTLLLLLLAAQPTPSSASNGWSDTDPLVTITTPGGNTVAVYDQVGAEAPGTLVDAQTARIIWTVKSEQAGTATQVTLSTVVPCNALYGCGFRSRSIVSSGAWSTGTVYGSAYGTAGQVMTVRFIVGVP